MFSVLEVEKKDFPPLRHEFYVAYFGSRLMEQGAPLRAAWRRRQNDRRRLCSVLEGML